MRDNNEGMIELLDISKSDNIYSSLIRMNVSGEYVKVRFGIETSDYNRLRRILEFWPFENTGAGKYRYFFTGGAGKDPDNEKLASIGVRVEQLDRHKQYEFCVSRWYASNIIWFYERTDKKEIDAKMIEE